MNSSSLIPGIPLIESPLFEPALPEMGLTKEETRIAKQLNVNGFAVLDFPDPQLHKRIDRIKRSLGAKFDLDTWINEGWKNNDSLRLQDAWQYDEDVKAIALNQYILQLLGRLYGRRAFAFQTLNFPVGTQQHYHSDAIHFSSSPARFMCGVWVALEDIQLDAGPLIYYPGSHRWPILSNELLGRRAGSIASDIQQPYESIWRAMVEASNIEGEVFLPRKGQALIWTANLLHGGSQQNNPHLTRWSQVTHYYFEGCIYYKPQLSEPSLGRLDLRHAVDIKTGEHVPNIYVDEHIDEVGRLPDFFDPTMYYALNPDVEASGADAATHYLRYGRKEGRKYR